MPNYYNVERFPIEFNDKWFSPDKIKIITNLLQDKINDHCYSFEINQDKQQIYGKYMEDYQYYEYK